MKVHQFRCWPSLFKNTTNLPDEKGYSNISASKMFSGNNILTHNDNEGEYGGIVQIGIQGAPGTRFWLNNGQLSSNPDTMQGIVLNWTGIFEIDLSDIGGEINSVVFDPSSATLYTETKDSVNYKIIVDILYDNNNGGVQ